MRLRGGWGEDVCQKNSWARSHNGEGPRLARHYLKAIRCVLFLIMDERVREKNGVRDRIAAERWMRAERNVWTEQNIFSDFTCKTAEKKKTRNKTWRIWIFFQSLPSFLNPVSFMYANFLSLKNVTAQRTSLFDLSLQSQLEKQSEPLPPFSRYLVRSCRAEAI